MVSKGGTGLAKRKVSSKPRKAPMKLLIAPSKKPAAVKTEASTDLAAQISRLERQNTTLKRAIARLQVYRAMAYRDPLTALWNRRYFEERLKEEFSRSRRAGVGRRFSVAIIDINGFKDIND